MDKRDTLLLACGTADSRGLLRSVFAESYHLLEADHSRQARLLLEQNHRCIAAVLLDISAPEKFDSGHFSQVHMAENVDAVPVIVITPSDDPEQLHNAFSLGAIDVIPLHYQPYAMLQRVHNIVELYLHKRHLEELAAEQAAVLRSANDRMVDVLSSIIEHRSVESGQHILRIRHFTKLVLDEVARTCPEYGLNDQNIRIISGAAALHDIGKISIPDSILNKPGKLTDMEREIMKSHTLTGCHILESLGEMGDRDYLRYAHNICHYHHERWDGGGYPEGLAGEDIPICAQVVGLADAFDALISPRVYKAALPFSRAVNMILRGECGIFSPKLLECFKHVSGQLETLARAYADGQSPQTESFDLSLPPPSPEVQADSLTITQSKYLALLHYADVLLMEADLDRQFIHILYNPYPELALLQEANGFGDTQRILLEYLLAPEDRKRMEQVLSQDIPRFFQEGLRRQSHRFRIGRGNGQDPVLFEITLLRPRPSDPARHLLILWRRLNSMPDQRRGAELFLDIATSALLDEIYCCRNDRDFTLADNGRALQTLAGYSSDELREQFGNRLLELVLPEDREALREAFISQFARGKTAKAQYRVRHKSGRILWVMSKSQLLAADDGQEYLLNMMLDISDARRDFDRLRQDMDRYEIILAQTENVLFEWDMTKDAITISDTWQDIFGYAPMRTDIRSRLTTDSHFHPDDIPLLLDAIHAIIDGSDFRLAEVRIATASGRYLWCRIRASALRDDRGGLVKIVGIIINVDDEKRESQALQDQAERDTLTKLLNKQAAQRQTEEYLASYPNGAPCALLVIDLDNFKYVNDHYGHLFGDAVLSQVAREIRRLFRAQDIVARIGGDEFLVVMRGISDRTLVQRRCIQLLEALRRLFNAQKSQCPLSCSIGVALAPEHGTVYHDLFHRADLSLYQTKDAGKDGFRFYDAADPAFHRSLPSTIAKTRIDSDEQPGLTLDNLAQNAFHQLYTATDLDAAILHILGLVGQQTNVSRVYVFENDSDDRFCSNTYEWCNTDIPSEKDNLQHISYREDIPGYREVFDGGDILYCTDIGELPPAVQRIVKPQGIRSMLHCALRDNGRFFGYMGFDDCASQRLWTQEQIDVLTYLSEILSVFLQKRNQKRAERPSDTEAEQ